MPRWSRGEADVERMLSLGDLQNITGGQADGEPWIQKARRTLDTAESIARDDPESSFALAYDSARFACTALLAQQGLRPTTKGGHVAVEEAVRAQFGDTFRPYRALRMRRNEIEYPSYPDELVDHTESVHALGAVEQLVSAAEKLLPHLVVFR